MKNKLLAYMFVVFFSIGSAAANCGHDKSDKDKPKRTTSSEVIDHKEFLEQLERIR